MPYNFNEIIVRENTNCLKYDARKARFGNENVLPMWVADMDFRVPPCVTQAILSVAEHAIYGYHIKTEKYYNAIINWYSSRHGYTPEAEGIFFAPGIVPAISYLVQCLTERGDNIIVQPPVYYPFFQVVSDNGRHLVLNELIEHEGTYSIDFEDFEKKARTARMFILCSPHNPVCRVWTRKELLRLAEICHRHNVLIISDEIHNDLVFAPHKHIPIAGLSPEFDEITVTCHAPSKTFNLAGLSVAYMFTKSRLLRKKIADYLAVLHIDGLNPFGLDAMVAAYTEGNNWHAELMAYINENYRFTQSFISEHLPMLRITPLEATYLLWIDFRALGLKDHVLRMLMIEKAEIGLNHGPIFGNGGSGFQRMNIACPRATLIDGLNRIKKAISGL